ncbi:hypothetical protein OHT61_32120 [Streptomyces sp. NBC_00178]|uniref:hypothetical protein n=1 Tax=Streptomyces sp. NBC_00178 TaxID=2975672 RepID=UPI002E2C4F26|nr:hypothetical protein [Streptomyces sp. NBC_00178]
MDYEVRRRGYRSLPDVQRELAGRREGRARLLRVAACQDDGEGLSVREAVALAAVQLGLQPPPA